MAALTVMQPVGHYVFRADASLEIGTGHIMRCLTLADALKSRGAKTHFICREHSGNLNSLIEEKGHTLHRLTLPQPPSPPDGSNNLFHAPWLKVSQEQDFEESKEVIQGLEGSAEALIVDHYALDSHWEAAIKPSVKQLWAIDDIADRQHDCDTLIDSNACDASRYISLVPKHCKLLLGPTYALLRDEFKQARQSCKIRSGPLQRLFINMGGVDIHDVSSKALEAVKAATDDSLSIDLVIGGQNPHKSKFTHPDMPPHIQVHVQSKNIAQLMAQADLAIGASGTSTWERCCVGLPTLTIILAENQETVASESVKQGCAISLGHHSHLKNDTLTKAVVDFFEHPDKLEEYSRNCLKLVDGDGVTRIIDHLQL